MGVLQLSDYVKRSSPYVQPCKNCLSNVIVFSAFFELPSSRGWEVQRVLWNMLLNFLLWWESRGQEKPGPFYFIKKMFSCFEFSKYRFFFVLHCLPFLEYPVLHVRNCLYCMKPRHFFWFATNCISAFKYTYLAMGSYFDSFAHTFFISVKMCKSTFHLFPGVLLGSFPFFSLEIYSFGYLGNLLAAGKWCIRANINCNFPLIGNKMNSTDYCSSSFIFWSGTSGRMLIHICPGHKAASLLKTHHLTSSVGLCRMKLSKSLQILKQGFRVLFGLSGSVPALTLKCPGRKYSHCAKEMVQL